MQDQLEDEREGTGPLEWDIEKLSAVRPLHPKQLLPFAACMLLLYVGRGGCTHRFAQFASRPVPAQDGWPSCMLCIVIKAMLPA